MLSLRQIEILRAVILLRTTAGAARALGMSQPAVSNALRKMESSLGFQLFDRSANRLVPLEAAKILFEDSEPMLAVQLALKERIDDLRTDKLSRLRILSTGPLGLGILPRVLKKFAVGHPGLGVRFDIRRLSQVVRAAEAGQADIGFGIELGAQPGLTVEPLHSGAMVCVCPPDHPLAQCDAVTAQDLHRYDFIALDARSTLGEVTRDGFRKADVPFDFAVEVSNTATACAMARAGFGCALVDPWTPRQVADRDLIIRPFRPDLKITAYAFWSERRPLSRTGTQFLAAVRRAIPVG